VCDAIRAPADATGAGVVAVNGWAARAPNAPADANASAAMTPSTPVSERVERGRPAEPVGGPSRG
jgi:hypothetical protein